MRSTSRTRPATPSFVPDGLPESALSGRIHGGAAERNLSDIKKISFFMDECKRMGLSVLGPDRQLQ